MIKVIEKELEILLDPESKLPYEAEGYRLEDGSLVVWDHKSHSWRDQKDRIYTEVSKDNELVGFNRRDTIAPEDKEILKLTPEGRAYLEYNEQIGGDRIGQEIPNGYPQRIYELLEAGETLEGIYKECIARGICWEEYLRCYENNTGVII